MINESIDRLKSFWLPEFAYLTIYRLYYYYYYYCQQQQVVIVAEWLTRRTLSPIFSFTSSSTNRVNSNLDPHPLS